MSLCGVREVSNLQFELVATFIGVKYITVDIQGIFLPRKYSMKMKTLDGL